jgi:hypothetical protein
VPSFTVAEVAAEERVGVHVVLRWIASGELKAHNAARHANARRPSWRITAEALDAFRAVRTPTPAPRKGRRRRGRQEYRLQFYA